MEELPRYEHDCSEEFGCHFIGYLDDYDVWYHDHSPYPDSIIGRHSSSGPDYSSIMADFQVNENWDQMFKDFYNGLLNKYREAKGIKS